VTDRERVVHWFAEGRLMSPQTGAVNFVDLVRALARLTGAAEVPSGPGVTELEACIGPAVNHVFVLLDGLGTAQLRDLPDDSFLRLHAVLDLVTVFPSTTATVLTTLATGHWPAAHGIPGWWTYLPDRDLCAVTLPFTERGTRRPLGELSVPVSELLPLPSLWPRLTHRPLTLLPAPVSASVYSRWACGDTAVYGYLDLDDAFATVLEAVTGVEEPTFNYLYLPQYDGLCHERGVTDPQVRDLLREMDRRLGDLANALAGRARLVITADHGLVDTPPERQILLEENDPLLPHLRSAPSAERTAPVFHCRPDEAAPFAAAFRERFGDRFALLTPDEAAALGLYGPELLSAIMRERLGSYVGVALEPVQLLTRMPGGGEPFLTAVHGGLTPAEMQVPLILA
jgi:hypothetical protein